MKKEECKMMKHFVSDLGFYFCILHYAF